MEQPDQAVRPRPVEILLVESQLRYIEAARQTFSGARLRNSLHVVESGDAALDFVYRRGRYKNAPRPDLILLDPAISGRNGWTVFAEIKVDPELKQIPVVIQTVSKSEAELLKIYNLNDLFITKPICCDDLIEVLRTVDGFGMAIVRHENSPQPKARAHP